MNAANDDKKISLPTRQWWNQRRVYHLILIEGYVIKLLERVQARRIRIATKLHKEIYGTHPSAGVETSK